MPFTFPSEVITEVTVCVSVCLQWCGRLTYIHHMTLRACSTVNKVLKIQQLMWDQLSSAVLNRYQPFFCNKSDWRGTMSAMKFCFFCGAKIMWFWVFLLYFPFCTAQTFLIYNKMKSYRFGLTWGWVSLNDESRWCLCVFYFFYSYSLSQVHIVQFWPQFGRLRQISQILQDPSYLRPRSVVFADALCLSSSGLHVIVI